MGLFATGTSGFAVVCVRGRNRVPLPPHGINAFTAFTSLLSFIEILYEDVLFSKILIDILLLSLLNLKYKGIPIIMIPFWDTILPLLPYSEITKKDGGI